MSPHPQTRDLPGSLRPWTRRVGALLLLLGWIGVGCSTAEGDGEVHSDRLFIDGCWNGSYDLKPSFFAANPYRDTMLIRIQRGEDIEELSDGLIVMVNNVDGIREGLLDTPIEVGLPSGVQPVGTPIRPLEEPLVSLSLYLHQTCHEQNGSLHAVEGTITFSDLFSGDPNEPNGDDRLTEARFDATFVDPRDATADGSYPAGRVSRVTGWFRFFFQRGQPAQPFP
ncbi:MAG: hypothetical protein R3B89_19885 [Polyangiaceae bacterium]